uniref:Uncharacterized protein n=1 Tax=Leersia perrieri TaxID=77586 RepID=A0A0D9VV99_9ORYZ
MTTRTAVRSHASRRSDPLALRNRPTPSDHTTPAAPPNIRRRYDELAAAFLAVFCFAERATACARGGKYDDDGWNFIAAGAATSGFLRLRQGPLPAGRAALSTGLFCAIVECASLVIHRVINTRTRRT